MARSSRPAEALLLVLVGLLSIAASAFWLARHGAPLWTDEAVHYSTAVKIRAALDGPWPEAVPGVFDSHAFYPPLQPLVVALLMPVLGRDARPLALALSVLTTAAILWAFRLLSRNSRSPGGAVPAAVLLVTAPAFVMNVRTLQLDAPLAAAVILALAFLERSDGFSRTAASLAAGLFLGLALLLKWTAAVALGLPFLVGSLRAAVSPGRRRRVLAAGALLLAAALAGPWYASHATQLRDFSRSSGSSAWSWTHSGGGTLDPANWLYDLGKLPELLGPVGAAAVAAGLVLRGRRFPALATAFLCLLAFVSLVRVKSTDRYLLPVFPAAAFLAGSACSGIERRRVRVGLLAVGLPLQLIAVLPTAGLLGIGAPGPLSSFPRLPWMGPAFPPSKGEQAAEVERAVFDLLDDGRGGTLFLASDHLLGVPQDAMAFTYVGLRAGRPLVVTAPSQAGTPLEPERPGIEELLAADLVAWRDVLPVLRDEDGTRRFRLAWVRFLNGGPEAFLRSHARRSALRHGNGIRTVLLRRTGDPDEDEIREVAAAAFRMLPGDPGLFHVLARRLRAPVFSRAAAGLEAIARGDAPGGGAVLGEAWAERPDDPLLLDAWAWAALRAGRGAAVAREVRARAPRGSIVVGQVLLAENDPAAALDVFLRDPGYACDARSWEGIAAAHEALGRREAGAAARLRAEALRERDRHPAAALPALRTLARVAMEEEKFREAIPHLREAVVLDPGDVSLAAWLLIAVSREHGAEAAREELGGLLEWNGAARSAEPRLRAFIAESVPR